MKLLKVLPIALLMIVAGASCTNKKNTKDASGDYARSLSDSIAIVQQQIDSCQTAIEDARTQIEEWLPDFETVTNPREAGSYMIYRAVRNSYPLQHTGITARIDDAGILELIAALDTPFDQIGAVTDTESVDSDVVPNDQALNYRTANLTTVMFSGQKANDVAKFIADNQLNAVRVNYYSGGRNLLSRKIPEGELKAIMATWMLYDAQTKLQQLERRQAMLGEKVKIFRAHKDK